MSAGPFSIGERAYPGEEDELWAVLLGLVGADQVVGVGVGKVEPGASSPMAEQPSLDVISLELSSEESVAAEEDLRGGSAPLSATRRPLLADTCWLTGSL